MAHHERRRSGTMEFHVSRTARDLYQFDEALFSQRGNVVFANFHGARVFAQKINDKRDLVNFPEQAVIAGQVNAMGMIDEMLHLIVERYRAQQNPQVMQQALAYLDQRLSRANVDAALHAFAEDFPPLAVYRGELELPTYIQGSTDAIPNREVLLEEMLMLWLANANPAFEPFIELFDDERLERQTVYPNIITGLQQFFDGQPAFAGGAGTGTAASGGRLARHQSLFAVLRNPALASPHSLTGQLEFLLGELGGVVGKFTYRLLSSLDLIKEEAKLVFVGPAGPGGGGDAQPYDFSGQEHEQENFTPDREWMPRLVLIAKNAFVWLDQLSKQYQRPINTLDQIPDEELDRLAGYGITGLWLIGLWERSTASRTIKQIMGNTDAVASAYSLYDYVIAHDLGGEGAVAVLREKAWQRGIRLASDMVPNHTGIDGRWVIEHPDWFISLPYSPYPSYTFNGPDLSWDDRVGVFLEDHYYNHSDAAVVFKRVDRHTGSEQYIYHGNDGTSMPWNDTAQLNYLNPELREAVIQTILHVARQFPVIRFDAAMTLAKRHIQRLWFPEPGTGGAIASRSEYAMTKAQFDALIPQEFWREVVDRAAVEAPDTLLLAEAFWMMEGYFVRTLGMHRVYNSAFMNMLRDEKNGEYRVLMKNTLEFDAEILKRYVNFMNNPDERSAVEQFGSGDKYFGICTLMVTLPGLPMLGHGQIEGFAEKYGMEYRRAYWDEARNEGLMEHHERIIFPLMHRRYLFADVEHFLLYDVMAPEGHVLEDVFAYSNRHGDERALVVYHNKYATVRGFVRQSAAFMARRQDGERELQRQTLGDGLALQHDANYFTIFRDQVSGLEYICNSRELSEQGLQVELGPYQHHVFLDFREVQDTNWQQYAQLAAYLHGRGVPSMDEAAREIFLQPVHQPFKELVNAELFQRLIAARGTSAASTDAAEQQAALGQEPNLVDGVEPLLAEVDQKVAQLFVGINDLTGGNGNTAALTEELRRELVTMLRLPLLTRKLASSQTSIVSAGDSAALALDLGDNPQTWGVLFSWLFTHALGKLSNDADHVSRNRSLIDEWLLGRIMASTFLDLAQSDVEATRSVALVKLMVSNQEVLQQRVSDPKRAYPVLMSWLKDSEVQQFLRVNRHRGILWFSKEAFEQLLSTMLALALVTIQTQTPAVAVNGGAEEAAGATVAVNGGAEEAADATVEDAGQAWYALVQHLQQMGADANYQLDALLTAAKGGASDLAEAEVHV